MASAPPPTPLSNSDSAYVQPLANWRLMLDGTDLAERINPRLISLDLSESRGEEADELNIELHDHDGMLKIPATGVRLTLALGWIRGTGVTPGLVEKGAFLVDEVNWQGPPDRITLRARSADFSGKFRTRKNRIWPQQSLGAIIGAIAVNHGLTAHCHNDLATILISAVDQANRSDMQLLRDLGRRYDAIATVKMGRLIFAPVNAGTTATGGTLPNFTISRQSGDGYSYRRSDREGAQKGVEAQWHDGKSAKRKTVRVGSGNHKRLKRVYGSESDARAAANAEMGRLNRAAATAEITLAYGNPMLSPGQQVTLSGFKPEIDKGKWRIAAVKHSMGASGGFTTNLQLELTI